MLQDAVNAYIASLSARTNEHGGNNRNTIMAYRNDLNQLCGYLSLHGLEDWSQTTREHITDYLLEIREAQSYRPTTVARKLAALKTFFRFLYDTQVIPSDPVKKLEAPKVEKELPQILSSEQISNLFCQVLRTTPGGKRDFAMLHMLYATGMRVSELISLNLADFDVEHKTVLCPGRNGRTKRERVLPLPPAAMDAMLCYLQTARPFLAKRAEEQSLFLNHHGDRLTRQGFWLIIKGYARQAGIVAITPHMLRHSFAMQMLKNGMELRAIQKLLGHAHISTTQIYSQLAQATLGEE